MYDLGEIKYVTETEQDVEPQEANRADQGMPGNAVQPRSEPKTTGSEESRIALAGWNIPHTLCSIKPLRPSLRFWKFSTASCFCTLTRSVPNKSRYDKKSATWYWEFQGVGVASNGERARLPRMAGVAAQQHGIDRISPRTPT